jgi:hypothetical protein
MNLPAMPRRRLLQTALLPIAAPLLALGGCATAPNSAADREALLTRAREFWKAVKANDMIAAWKYEQASKDPRATLQDYLRRGGGILYDAAEVTGVRSIDGDQAVVDVKITYTVPVARITAMPAAVQDAWTRLDGQWFHVVKPLE